MEDINEVWIVHSDLIYVAKIETTMNMQKEIATCDVACTYQAVINNAGWKNPAYDLTSC